MSTLLFKPSLFRRNGHVQTLLGSFYKTKSHERKFQREVFKLSDGDQITYHRYDGTSDYIITIGHGLTGSNRANYIKSISHVRAIRLMANMDIQHTRVFIHVKITWEKMGTCR